MIILTESLWPPLLLAIFSRVFLNRDLNTSTLVDVYKAACISTLLFGNEAWTLYRSRVAYASLPRFTSVVFSEFSG